MNENNRRMLTYYVIISLIYIYEIHGPLDRRELCKETQSICQVLLRTMLYYCSDQWWLERYKQSNTYYSHGRLTRVCRRFKGYERNRQILLIRYREQFLK